MKYSAASGLPRRTLLGIVLLMAALAAPGVLCAQQASVSAWEAAKFRSWSFIPYWTSTSQVTSFGTDRVYDHLSDVVYHSGVQPRADGTLYTSSTAATHLATIKSQQAQFGFRSHLDMFDAVRNSGESALDAVERVWNAITGNATTRATFVNNVKNVLAANNMTGFNLDWERPSTVAEWGNYTQLAKDLQAAFPASWEVSVDDYGSTSSLWDDSPLFDAAAYDQIGMMAYHYTAASQATFANGKKALDDQGASKAFKDSQIIIGMGTWGEGPSTASLKSIVAVAPNLPADATSYTGTVGGVTGTWDIVSRYEVRDNVQLALDRGMAGVMWWALNYDATNKMSLARVAQHYAMVKRAVPDLTLDGKVNAADANALADNMGTATTATGMTTQAQFENFYQNGNWERGDRDANGFINQADADWLAGRYAALGVALPDRLAFSGTFEKFAGAVGLAGRWQAGRTRASGLTETGNFTQQNPGAFAAANGGPGGAKYSNSSVVIRNQTTAELSAGLNGASRTMRSTLATPLDLGEQNTTYFTFLVRQNTGPLSTAQFESLNRTLSLEMLDASGASQFDFTMLGRQTDFAIRSQADAAGQDVQGDGFGANLTYMVLGKISGNGAGAHTLQASLLPGGSYVPNFSDPAFQWMLTAEGGADYNPVITQLQFTSAAEGNFTVSNVMIGPESAFFAPPAPGDFDADTNVNVYDLALWMENYGMPSLATHWHGDADGDGDADGGDFLAWQRTLGASGLTAAAVVPEPATAVLAALGLGMCARMLRRL
jgi:hypothetical protein